MPKARLHVHLESAVRWSTLVELVDSNGVVLPERATPFDGLRQFADHDALLCSCLRRPEDFTRVAAEFCADAAAEGVGFVEVTFTATAHGERLGDLEMPLLTVLAGLTRGRRSDRDRLPGAAGPLAAPLRRPRPADPPAGARPR